MTGIYGNSQEDKHYEKMLNDYLDADFKYEDRLESRLEDVAFEAMSDSDWLFTLYDEEPTDFMDQLAQAIAENDFAVFKNWAHEGLKKLGGIQSEAETQVQEELADYEAEREA